jgi:uncharacterized protein YigE (DUF2233 family)
MKDIIQGSSLTVRMRLKNGGGWVNFEEVANLAVSLMNANTNAAMAVPSGQYTVFNDVLTLYVTPAMTQSCGRYRVHLSFVAGGNTVVLRPYVYHVHSHHRHDLACVHGVSEIEYDMAVEFGVASAPVHVVTGATVEAARAAAQAYSVLHPGVITFYAEE